MRHIFASINYIERHVIYLWSAFRSSFNCYTLWSHFSEPSRFLFRRVIWVKSKREIEMCLYLILARIKALKRLSNDAQVQNEQVLMDSSEFALRELCGNQSMCGPTFNNIVNINLSMRTPQSLTRRSVPRAFQTGSVLIEKLLFQSRNPFYCVLLPTILFIPSFSSFKSLP